MDERSCLLYQTMKANLFCIITFGIAVPSALAEPLVWERKAEIPGPGRHHPITFANETHAFYLTGTTSQSTFTNDFYMYEEATDQWTDLSSSRSAFPGKARSFGYGIVLNEALNTKAYLGFGAALDGERLSDWWEFDMETHVWKRLADFSGSGRRHPAMVPVLRNSTHWEIHVGLGDGSTGNFNDWYSYDVNTNTWTQMPDFPSSKRHHPFYFGIGNLSFAGLGHSDGFDPYIERDWYQFDGSQWIREPDFASYSVSDDGIISTDPVSTEARVAGTEFSIELPSAALGFVLSGDGDDHRTMETGEFHAFYPSIDGAASWWRELPPHPGQSRWAPGSFVMRGSARAYFTSGYDRVDQVLYNDLWTIDLSPLFAAMEDGTLDAGPASTPTIAQGEGAPSPSVTPTQPPSTSDALSHCITSSSIVFGALFLVAHLDDWL